MAADFLKTILEKKRASNERKRPLFDNLKGRLEGTPYARYGLFKAAVSRPGRVNLIAEIKKASPSQGVIREDFNVEELARAYQDCGAAAISVLTEEDHFLGKPAYLKQVSEKFNTPTLMKDFVIDEGQIYEGRYCGASAVLLIVAALTDAELKHLLAAGAKLDVDCLVEVHGQDELDRALMAGAGIIGINNRDLRTFRVDLATTEKLVPRIPGGIVIVAESGISTQGDVRRLKAAGVHAVLIGEAFLKEKDVRAKVRDIMREA